MRPLVFQCRECVEVLQLGKGEESRCRDDIDKEKLGQALIVKIKRVLKSEKVMAIRMHDSSVLDHVDVFWRPSCCDVGNDSLLKERPVSREANEEWS